MQVHSIPYHNTEYYLNMLSEHTIVFLDSAKKHSSLGRYSYIAINPFEMLTATSHSTKNHIFSQLQQALNQYQQPFIDDLPPFQGGVAGYFSYDFFRLIEPLRVSKHQVHTIPLCQLGYFDLVISFDHIKQKAWIISTGHPENQNSLKKVRSKKRLAWLLEALNATATQKKSTSFITSELRCNFSDDDYMAAINKVKNYILNGDIFQANISRCFEADLHPCANLLSLYFRLRKINPAPFAAFIQFPGCTLLSSSPERFIKVEGSAVETRPIKGTIAIQSDIKQDQLAIDAFIKDPKERAENTMIVDLMRNDLSRVCKAGSIQVPRYCQLESYETVHHLVSVITGELKSQHSIVDLLKSSFPGGSITGAPKIRAMEIIEEIEPVTRGPYCGSIGYLGFNGHADTAITIRTMVANNHQISFHAGGAIVLDSDPKKELIETETKASALKRALVEGPL